MESQSKGILISVGRNFIAAVAVFLHLFIDVRPEPEENRLTVPVTSEAHPPEYEGRNPASWNCIERIETKPLGCPRIPRVELKNKTSEKVTLPRAISITPSLAATYGPSPTVNVTKLNPLWPENPATH